MPQSPTSSTAPSSHDRRPAPESVAAKSSLSLLARAWQALAVRADALLATAVAPAAAPAGGVAIPGSIGSPGVGSQGLAPARVPARERLYDALSRVRPMQLADVLKPLLGVRRIPLRAGRATFVADPSSLFGHCIRHEGTWERPLTAVVRCLIRPDDTFVDVGGNEGYFSVLAALEYSGVRAHCIEPQARLRPVIQENVRRNGLEERVKVHTVAITDADGEARLFLRPSNNTGMSSLRPHWKIGWRSVSVPTTTLDHLTAANGIGRARLLKVDCEGAEDLVLRGARRLLARHAFDFIALEYHPSIIGVERCVEIDAALREAGYALCAVNGRFVYHLPGLERDLAPLAPEPVGAGSIGAAVALAS